ncbi:MAG: TIGR03668 family PPOX class F420-dependent oxidoreductase [Hyphomicrobiales bacterium]
MSGRAELHDWERELIDGLRVARLGSIARDGRPHLVPVCYARVGGEFAVAIDEKPKRGGELARLRNIRRDPRVTLLFDQYDDDWRQLAWVRVDGEAAVFERGEKRRDALAALRSRYPQYREMRLEALPLIAIRALNIASWRWERGS